MAPNIVEQHVTVLKILEPNHFLVKELLQENCSTGAQLFAQLEEYLNNYDQFDVIPGTVNLPIKGAHVLVKPEDENNWYRGRVEAILETTKGARVRTYLLDYGKIKTACKEWIRNMPSKLMQVPFQAVHFVLPNLRPCSLNFNVELSLTRQPSDSWDRSAIEAIKEVVKVDKTARVIVEHFDEDGPCFGQLIVNHQENSINVNELLYARHFACDILHGGDREKLVKETKDGFWAWLENSNPSTLVGDVLVRPVSSFSGRTSRQHNSSFSMSRDNVSRGPSSICKTPDSVFVSQLPHGHSTPKKGGVGRGQLLLTLSSQLNSSPNRNHRVSNVNRHSMSLAEEKFSSATDTSSSTISISCCSTDCESTDQTYNSQQFLNVSQEIVLSALHRNTPRRSKNNSVNPSSPHLALPPTVIQKQQLPSLVKTSKNNLELSSGKHLDYTNRNRPSTVSPNSERNSVLEPQKQNKPAVVQNERISQGKASKISPSTSDKRNGFIDIKRDRNMNSSRHSSQQVVENVCANNGSSLPYFKTSNMEGNLLGNHSSTILRFGSMIPKPVKSLYSSSLTDILIKRLDSLGFPCASKIQSNAWPAILRGRSVVLIAPKVSGKTLAYLLPLLSFLLQPEDYKPLETCTGPLAVILCAKWTTCQLVLNECQNLLPTVYHKKIACLYGGLGNQNKEVSLLGGCDLLITTATYYLKVQENVPMDRVCHLVLDEADILTECFTDEIKEIMVSFVNQFKSNALRSSLPNQVVMCTSRCTGAVQDFMRNLMLDPIVLVSSFSEAMVYTKVPVFSKFTTKNRLSTSLVELLQSRNRLKTVVCVTSAVITVEVSRFLNCHAIYALAAHEEMEHFNLKNVKTEWEDPSCSAVLVVSDHVLPELNVTSAEWLIHYDIPRFSYLVFGYRFVCLAGNIQSKASGEYGNRGRDSLSHVLLTEDCEVQSLELIRFFKRLGSEVPEKLLELASKKQLRKPLCLHLQAFGLCKFRNWCVERHIPKKTLDQPSTNLPHFGEVKVLVKYILDASQFYGLLLDCRNPSTGAKTSFRSSYAQLQFELTKHFGNTDNLKVHESPKVGDVCGLYKPGDAYHRVKVVALEDLEMFTLRRVKVFFIDEGMSEVVEVKNLLKLPQNVLEIPLQAVHFYACGVEPADGHQQWTPDAGTYVHNNMAGKVILAKVALCLKDSLFLERAVICTQLLNSTNMITFNHNQELIKQGFAVANPDHVSALRKLCEGEIAWGKENAGTNITSGLADPRVSSINAAVLRSSYCKQSGPQRSTTNPTALGCTSRRPEPPKSSNNTAGLGTTCSSLPDSSRFGINPSVSRSTSKPPEPPTTSNNTATSRPAACSKLPEPPKSLTDVSGSSFYKLCNAQVIKTTASVSTTDSSCSTLSEPSTSTRTTSPRSLSRHSDVPTVTSHTAPTSLCTNDSESPRSTPQTVPVPDIASVISRSERSRLVPKYETFSTSGVHKVFVSVAETPLKFYVQSASTYDRLLQLNDSINKLISDDKLLRVTCPTTGLICVSSFGDDCEQWYRARILAQVSKNMFKVFFVDFGDSAVVPISNLFEITRELLELPFQAVDCSLANLGPVNGSWHEDIGGLLLDLTREEEGIFKEMNLKVLSSAPSTENRQQICYTVKISEPNCKSVASQLVEMSLAVKYRKSALQASLSDEEADGEYSPMSTTPEPEEEKKMASLVLQGLMAENARSLVETTDDESVRVKIRKPRKNCASVARDSPPNPQVPLRADICTDMPMLEVVPNAVPSLVPKVQWYQTKTELILIVQVHSYQEYEFYCTSSSIVLNVLRGDQFFLLQETLFDNVVPTLSQSCSLGPVIKLKLHKYQRKRWPRLLKKTEKAPNITYHPDHVTLTSCDETASVISSQSQRGRRKEKFQMTTLHFDPCNMDDNQNQETESDSDWSQENAHKMFS